MGTQEVVFALRQIMYQPCVLIHSKMSLVTKRTGVAPRHVDAIHQAIAANKKLLFRRFEYTMDKTFVIELHGGYGRKKMAYRS